MNWMRDFGRTRIRKDHERYLVTGMMIAAVVDVVLMVWGEEV